MARLVLIGERAQVELTADQVEGGTIATCLTDGCPWTETYDTLDDASEYAADHADRGTCPSEGWTPPPAGTVDAAVAELKELEARDRAAGGPPWEVPDHPDHDLPGGWHRGQII